METSIRKELTEYILDAISDEIISNNNREDWHHLLFNEDYYLIGYYECDEWLKKHGLSAWEAIEICVEYEKEMFGEHQTYDNAEKTVNMLVYIYGEELLDEINAETVEELEHHLS